MTAQPLFDAAAPLLPGFAKAAGLRFLTPSRRLGADRATVARMRQRSPRVRLRCVTRQHFISPCTAPRGFSDLDRTPMIRTAGAAGGHSRRGSAGGRGRMIKTGVRWAVCAACYCGCAARARPHARRRWNPRWRRPIATIRRSTRSAPRCARPTGRAAGARRLPSARHGIVRCGYQHFESISTSRRRPHEDQHQYQPARRQCRHWSQTRLQRQRTGNLTRQAEGPVLAGTRDAAQRRADRAARRRDRLHERAARHRDPRSAAPQRGGAAGAAASRRATASMSAR